MAASKKRKKKSNLHLDKDKRTLITTSRDVVVECLPVAALFMAMEENVKSSIEWPQVPIRISKDVAGAEMEFPLTLAHLETENATEEQKEAYADYQIALADAEAEFDDKITVARVRFLAWEGIKVADESLLAEWQEADEWLEMTVPEDERERMVHFLQTRILGNGDRDVQAILVGIYRASGYDKEVLDRVERGFRAEMGQRGGTDAQDGAGDIGAQEQGQEGGLVEQSRVPDSGDAQGAGADA